MGGLILAEAKNYSNEKNIPKINLAKNISPGLKRLMGVILFGGLYFLEGRGG